MSDSIPSSDISMVPVESWNINRVKPYEFNNKKHPEKHIDLLMRSIKAEGLLDPIVVDKNGVIISGHGRHEACKGLGYKKISVRVLRDITDAQASALRIAANKTVSNEFDTDMLSRELRALTEADYDTSSLGFDDKELAMLISDVGIMDEDSLVIDMDEAVDTHDALVSETSELADESNVPLSKVFGFKGLPLRDRRTVTQFMAEIEASSGKPPAEALVGHMRDFLSSTGPAR